MCRSIKTLRDADRRVHGEDIEAAPLQFVRKVTGYRNPSRLNTPALAEQAADLVALDDVAGRAASSAESTSEQLAGTDRRLSTAISDLTDDVAALSRQIDASDADAAERTAILDELTDSLAALTAVVDEVVRGPIRDYFQAFERIAQTYDGSTDERGDDLDAALLAGDLGWVQEIFAELVAATEIFATGVAALSPPASVAGLHEEARASLAALTTAVAQVAVFALVGSVEGFVAALERLVVGGGFEVIENRNDADCEALQDAAREFGIDVDLAC